MKHLSVLLCLIALAGTTRGETIVHQASAATAATGGGGTGTVLIVPRFDPQLGWLDQVSIAATLSATGAIGYENTSAVHDTVTMRFGAGCTVRAPGGATLASLASSIEATSFLEPFDGQVDFAGVSGRLAMGLSVGAESSWQAAGDPFWVAGLAAQGPVALDVQLFDLSSVSSSQRHVLRRGQVSVVDITVTYNYTPRVLVAD